MASIDRYRPPREGYQPPSLPPKPPVPADRLERLSRSPSRRNIPPPAPSPPTHSSRTSPPRPVSRRVPPSPANPPQPPAAPPKPRQNQWFFTPDEILSTPSIIDGLRPAEERVRRAKGVSFIVQAGILLELPQITLWVAAVFFHRFFMRISLVEEKGGIHHYNIAATALFLANKTQEDCRKTRDLIISVARVAQKKPNLIIDEQSKEYWRWRDVILTHEEVMLELLTFDLMVETPYLQLYEYLKGLQLHHNKRLREAAWAYCNDSSFTTLPLLMSSTDIAASALFFASASTGEKIDDVAGEPWWKHLRTDEERIIRAIDVMSEFYSENPLQKKDSRYQGGSPEFTLESTRRRGDTILSQTEAGSSQNGTPLGTDRGTTLSPRGRANGRAEREEEQPSNHSSSVNTNSNNNSNSNSNNTTKDGKESNGTLELESQREKGDSDAVLKAAANDLGHHAGGKHTTANGGGGVGLVSPGPVSPGIKRGSDPDLDAERQAKKPRLSDEDDEGEVHESS